MGSARTCAAGRFAALGLLFVCLFAANLYCGSVGIPWSQVTEILLHGAPGDSPLAYIVLESRLPQALTACLAGAALTVSGLMLQTAFRNPLAGPSVLGITSGAGLGVAVVMLFLGGSAAGLLGQAAVTAGAFAGSAAVMALLLLFSVWLRNDLMLLITGIMTGYLTSSVVTLLNYTSDAEGIQGYTLWGMGSFGTVTPDRMPAFAALTGAGLLLGLLLVKPLNVMQLGDNYARNLGVDMKQARNLMLCAVGVLTASVTAWCGPISFIGLAVPHIARMVWRTADQRILMPGCILTGAAVGLLCNLLCVLPSRLVLPLNGVTPLVGVPVILYVIFKGRRR